MTAASSSSGKPAAGTPCLWRSLGLAAPRTRPAVPLPRPGWWCSPSPRGETRCPAGLPSCGWTHGLRGSVDSLGLGVVRLALRLWHPAAAVRAHHPARQSSSCQQMTGAPRRMPGAREDCAHPPGWLPAGGVLPALPTRGWWGSLALGYRSASLCSNLHSQHMCPAKEPFSPGHRAVVPHTQLAPWQAGTRQPCAAEWGRRRLHPGLQAPDTEAEPVGNLCKIRR